jgi:hypothetical protein
MSDVFETIAKLREQYPDNESLATIAEDEKRVKALLERQEYSQLPVTQELIALCREAIVAARIILATDTRVNDDGRRNLFADINAHQWFLQMVAKDYDAELAAIAQQLERDLESDL